MKKVFFLLPIVCLIGFAALAPSFSTTTPNQAAPDDPNPFPAISEYLCELDMTALDNYANPTFPVHYDGQVFNQFDNTPNNNPVTDLGATLGRVLFFDKQLSRNNTIACASCHIQEDGFIDPDVLSTGFQGGLTGAHSMRLGNIRFYPDEEMFWDRRATSVEDQATQPIQDAVEMGFDAANGGIAALIAKMGNIPYYAELFTLVYGDANITENRMQLAIAQYVRSMVSVNSKFDDGMAAVYTPGGNNNINAPFPNFTPQENMGKALYLGAAGCNACHAAPTFGMRANRGSNGLDLGETTIFKSPSLKNIGVTGPYMHDGRFATLEEVIDFYSTDVQPGPALDNRLTVPGPSNAPLILNLNPTEKAALVAFLRTLDDDVLNTDPKFSSPFCADFTFTMPVVVKTKAMLEGAYDANTGLMTTHLINAGLLPSAQPFNTAPWNYTGTEFLASFPVDMVDWVLLEVRDGIDNEIIIEQKAAILLSNGDIVDVNCYTEGVNFYTLTADTDYFISIKHRHHLAVLSSLPVTLPNAVLYDFNQPANVMGQNQLSEVTTGVFCLSAGDYNSDGVISTGDFNGYNMEASSLNQYLDGDFNLDNNVTVADFNKYLPNSSKIGATAIRY